MANGIDVSRGAFVIAVETVDPFDVVVHNVDPVLVTRADQTLTVRLETYRNCRNFCPEPREVWDWPGRSQAPVEWTVPPWMQPDDEEDAADEWRNDAARDGAGS